MYTVGSLFSGIGGIDLAFQWAGFEIKWQVEIDDFCNRILEHHFSGAERFRDARDCGAHNLAAVDVVVGGVPCQPASTAGKRGGSSDSRWLWPEALRIVKEIQPKVVLFENVAGLRSLNDGNAFKQILWELAKIGYDAEWSHFRASDVGTPHKRERIFIVAYSGSRGGGSRRPEFERFFGGAAPIGSGELADASHTVRRENDRRERRTDRQDLLQQNNGQETNVRLAGGNSKVADTNHRHNLRTEQTLCAGRNTTNTGGQELEYATGAGLSRNGQSELSAPEAETARGLESEPQRSGSAELAKPNSVGDGARGSEQPGLERLSQTVSAGFELVNCDCQRLQEQSGDFAAKSPLCSPECSGCPMANPEAVGTPRPSESLMGRAASRFPGWLDRSRWPARPGQAQHDWEAPRTSKEAKNRVNRLKALGNAVVPAQVAPIAEAIHEYLTIVYPKE